MISAAIYEAFFPELYRALLAVRMADAKTCAAQIMGHTPDLSHFIIPQDWIHLIPPAEAGLRRLWNDDADLWQAVVIGWEGEASDIVERRQDLHEAYRLIIGIRDGWPKQKTAT